MKKVILFLEQQSWLSGAQRVLETVLDSLAEEYAPLVAFPDDGPFRRALAERGIETLTFPLGAYRSGQKSNSEMLEFVARSLLCGFRLAKVIRRRDIGLVYINGPRCLAAGVLAARLARRPSLFHLHLTLTRRPEILLAARLARFVSTIVACSKAAAAPLVDADRQLADKIQVLYNPVAGHLGAARDSQRSHPPSAGAPRFTLGVVSRITEAKGQRVLLNALGRLGPQLKDKIRVVFVGAPMPGNDEDLGYMRRLEACAAQFNLQTKIEWTGYQRELAPYYASMDVLVHPSLSRAGEGMPMAVLEALREGVPVIASWTGGIPEVIRNGWNGLLVPPGNEVRLAQALQRFLQDEPLRERLRAGACAGLDNGFSLENFNSKIHESIWKLSSPYSLKKTKMIREDSAA